MADIRDVVTHIMELQEDGCTTMKLQKLLYYCQGWHLAWDEVPLFDNEIEAWANGPVIRDVYNMHRGRFWLNNSWSPNGNPDNLSTDEKETIEAVCEAFSDWTACQMSEATHKERPWLEARNGLRAGERGSDSMDVGVIQDYFAGLHASV